MDIAIDLSEESKMKHSILSEDGTLKYDFMTTLQKIGIARLLSCLWMNSNTQQTIMDLYRKNTHVSWSNFFFIERHISSKISQLSLPKSISEELIYLVSIFRDVIWNWITYHDEHIFSTEESRYSSVDFLPNIAWTARGKIDYVETAKNILANTESCLSDNCKYNLACIYCLEDEIILLSSKSVNKFFLSCIEIDLHSMVYFWTAHITGDRIQLKNSSHYRHRNPHYGSMSIYEHIIQLLIKNDKTNNDVPIKFMWNKLSKEEKARNTELLFKNVDNPDFIFSLLSNLDYDQQQNILKEQSDTVLGGMLKNWWWWGKYFLPTALNVLDIMSPQSFWRILREINRKKCSSSQKKMYDYFKFLFTWLWQKGSYQLKEFIFHDNTWPLEVFVTSALNWERDMDIIELILNDLNEEQKKEIAFHGNSIRNCAFLIKNGELDKVNYFIRYTLSLEDNISHWKRILIEGSGRDIATSILNDMHKMECFVKWAFESEEEMYNFCQNLNYAIDP